MTCGGGGAAGWGGGIPTRGAGGGRVDNGGGGMGAAGGGDTCTTALSAFAVGDAAGVTGSESGLVGASRGATSVTGATGWIVILVCAEGCAAGDSGTDVAIGRPLAGGEDWTGLATGAASGVDNCG